MYVTPRTLLAIIRLSQALSKLSMREQVQQQDVDEALKLMDFSIRSLRTLKAKSAREQRTLHKTNERQDKMTAIVQMVRDMLEQEKLQSLNLKDIMRKMGKGAFSAQKFTKDEMVECLKYYDQLSVLMFDEAEEKDRKSVV